MNKILRLAAVGVLAFAALHASARGNVPIVNHEAIPAATAAGQPATPEQIRAALQAAGSPRGWEITPAGNGKALAVLNVRGKHSVSADISYTRGEYAIKYRESANMNYDAAANTIHPKYNMWVDKLIEDTRAQLLK
jgi:hypothetical protein